MTTKSLTGLLPKPSDVTTRARRTWGERLFQLAFSLIQWPWLLRSLRGGSAADKQALLARVGLPPDALPHLGSWKADTYLLHRIVDVIERDKPMVVVELGAGATSLVIAKALSARGGALHSYDQHEPFVAQMRRWLSEHGLEAAFSHAPLVQRQADWPGLWYRLPVIPDTIDMLVIDGPPWTVHPFVRGAAERLFPRIAPGGTVLLDDAARPGERIIARRWRRSWADFTFRYEGRGSKGLLVGQRSVG